MRAESGTPRARGFSLVELMVTLGVVAVLITGMLGILDSASKLTKEQSNLADALASSRSGIYEVTRILRQARTGQLSFENAVIPRINNAAGTETFTDLAGTVHTVRQGTDAIEVHGILYGDTYYFQPPNLNCGSGDCTGSSTKIAVTIQQTVPVTASSTVVNFPAGSTPSFSTRTTPFLFVLSTKSLLTIVAANGNRYAVPKYYVGRVDPTTMKSTDGGNGFYLEIDPTNTAARALDASADFSQRLDKISSGGVIDDVVFFVDRGPLDPLANQYLHPFLAQAVLDPSTGNWDVQPLSDDVEDFQVAYGIDGLVTSAVPRFDRGVDPAVTSTTVGGDEWAGNAGDGTASSGGEGIAASTPSGTTPVLYEKFLDTTFVDPAPMGDPYRPTIAIPALKSIMVSVVVKSHDPDLRYNGPGAHGVKVFDSTAKSISDPTITGGANGLPFRRRVQTMAVNLRNYL